VPEGLEAEIWRRAATVLIGRTVERWWVDERVAPPGMVSDLAGASVDAVDRIGKIVVLHLTVPRSAQTRSSAQPTAGRRLGLHFGMTGRLVVDGRAAIEQLAYASGRDDAAWDRLRLWTDAGPGGPGGDGDPGDGRVPALRLNDPRRLGRVSLDEDLRGLGPDVLAISGAELGDVLARRRAAVKTVLLDQGAVAGLGNLCADEVLWWAGIAPTRPADSLLSTEVAALHDAVSVRLPVMLAAGGSTTGVLSPEVRAACPPCERDGTPLRRATIGGRTAVWCPAHQD